MHVGIVQSRWAFRTEESLEEEWKGREMQEWYLAGGYQESPLCGETILATS